jgi:hypothetical protein
MPGNAQPCSFVRILVSFVKNVAPLGLDRLLAREKGLRPRPTTVATFFQFRLCTALLTALGKSYRHRSYSSTKRGTGRAQQHARWSSMPFIGKFTVRRRTPSIAIIKSPGRNEMRQRLYMSRPSNWDQITVLQVW